MVQMQLSVKRIGRTSLTIGVKVCAGAEVRVTATQVLVLISLIDGALVAIPDDLKARFAEFGEVAAS
jgi:acyl-CoA thioesterase FadM